MRTHTYTVRIRNDFGLGGEVHGGGAGKGSWSVRGVRWGCLSRRRPCDTMTTVFRQRRYGWRHEKRAPSQRRKHERVQCVLMFFFVYTDKSYTRMYKYIFLCARMKIRTKNAFEIVRVGQNWCAAVVADHEAPRRTVKSTRERAHIVYREIDRFWSDFIIALPVPTRRCRRPRPCRAPRRCVQSSPSGHRRWWLGAA